MSTHTVAELRQRNTSKLWQFATLTALVVAAGAIGSLYLQHQRLAQQLSVIQRQPAVLQAGAKPDLPLTVSFGPAVTGTGDVMTVQNNSGNTLVMALIITSAATGLVQRRTLLIPPNRIASLGAAQRLVFTSGQRVVFRNAAFKQAVYAVP